MQYAQENNEAIQLYLREMGRIPRLSPTEESAAANELAAARRCLRHHLLMSDYMQAKVAAVLRRLVRRQRRSDGTVGNRNLDADQARMRRLVARVLKRLRDSLRSNRHDLRSVMRPGAPRRELWSSILARRRRIASAINQLGIRTWQLQRWQRQVATIEAEMRRLANCAAALRDAPESDERAQDSRRKLRQLMRRMGESPTMLNRRLARARNCQRRYEAAKQRLVAGNLRLAVWAAKRARHRNVSFLDLIQEGNAGLLQAADRWDPDKGKFGTYAIWWVRQAIQRSITAHHGIRLPERVVRNARRVEGAARALVHQNQGRPDLPAIARLAGVSEEQAEQMLRMHRRPLSLDQPLGPMGESSAAELLQDPSRQAPLEEMSRGHLKQRLADVLTELNDRQRTVISLRFGLLDGCQRTLDEVGKLLSLSRERVRQIEAVAVERLRHPTRSHRLRGFLDVEDKHTMNRG